MIIELAGYVMEALGRILPIMVWVGIVYLIQEDRK